MYNIYNFFWFWSFENAQEAKYQVVNQRNPKRLSEIPVGLPVAPGIIRYFLSIPFYFLRFFVGGMKTIKFAPCYISKKKIQTSNFFGKFFLSIFFPHIKTMMT